MPSYTVLREHHGDRRYKVGDTREAREQTVAHLVQRGVLEPVETDRRAREPARADDDGDGKAGRAASRHKTIKKA